jgi:hypothetical protein
VETVVSIRGIPVEVHRRIVEDGAAMFRDQKSVESRPTHIYTAFLDSRHKVKADRGGRGRSLGFLVRVRVVPQYHVDKRLWRDEHFEGKPLFEDALEFVVTIDAKGAPTGVTCDFASELKDGRRTPLSLKSSGRGKNAAKVGTVHFRRPTLTPEDAAKPNPPSPVIEGDFVIRVEPWNNW